MPADQEAIYKIVGRSRWIRVVRIDLKPGRTAEFIEGWKIFKAELEKAAPELTFFVSQAMTGTPAMVVATYANSLGDFDAIDAQIRKAAESEAYTSFQRTVADAVDESRWEIQRLRPDLSSVPDDVAKVDPAFWHPKPPAATKPAKPKEAAK